MARAAKVARAMATQQGCQARDGDGNEEDNGDSNEGGGQGRGQGPQG
jgi:hypothetical protein